MKLYLLTDPIKWAWQRLTRGWDDRAVWSIDSYLAELMPQLLRKLKEDKLGIPGSMFENPFDDMTPEIEAAALAKWHGILDDLIDGFEAADRLANLDYLGVTGDELDALIAEDTDIFCNGMVLLNKYFFDLWD